MCHKCRDLIEHLLKKEQVKFDTPMKMMCWQRGYLTGLLQNILHDDPLLRKALLKKLKQ